MESPNRASTGEKIALKNCCIRRLIGVSGVTMKSNCLDASEYQRTSESNCSTWRMSHIYTKCNAQAGFKWFWKKFLQAHEQCMLRQNNGKIEIAVEDENCVQFLASKNLRSAGDFQVLSNYQATFGFNDFQELLCGLDQANTCRRLYSRVVEIVTLRTL